MRSKVEKVPERKEQFCYWVTLMISDQLLKDDELRGNGMEWYTLGRQTGKKKIKKDGKWVEGRAQNK